MRNIFVSIVMGITLAACGSGGEDAFRGSGQPGTPGGGSGTAVAAQITVVSSAPSIPSDGSQSATITAFARDATNNLISGVPVVFSATSGGLSGATGTTGADGTATVSLGTAGDSSIRTITVTATSGAHNANVTVPVIAQGGTTPITVAMGSGTGAGFQSDVLGVTNPSISAGGSTTLQAVLQQSDGTLYTQSASVNFNSACQAQGLATITNPVVTSTGIASATYAATGCNGADVITATATVGGTQLSANGTITVAPASIGSVIFVSATPTNVALRGTGSSEHPEVSRVIFRVLDSTGGPRAGTTVNFALNTTVGGISVSPASAQSDALGNVQTVVQGGTVATTVRVTATVQGVTPVLATQSSQLTITTGIPDQDSFSLSVQCPNVEGWSRDGVVAAVTARLSDRFNNPVPDGTAVTLQTEGGSIVSQCQTSGAIGACTVNWTSSNPRPVASAVGELRPGRSTLLATAIGEESFFDTNGNGSFDNGENFTDLPERYLDENENNVRDSFEPIYDFNNNSTYDAADGDFNGVLCLDTAGRCSTNVTTGIATKSLIIMSGSTPIVSPTSGSTLAPVIAAGATGTYAIHFEDLNGNPLPAQTTITGTVAGTGISLGQPGSFIVPCTTEPGSYPFIIVKDVTAGSGTLTVQVTTPSGLTTLLSYSIP
jgi:Bacterial Ig-like domain (group 1)